jgi:hypothetical protein
MRNIAVNFSIIGIILPDPLRIIPSNTYRLLVLHCQIVLSCFNAAMPHHVVLKQSVALEQL